MAERSGTTITVGDRGPAIVLVIEAEARPRIHIGGIYDGEMDAGIRRIMATLDQQWIDLLYEALRSAEQAET
jgi:hypothetical protein